mgnify:CR=1 FL=1
MLRKFSIFTCFALSVVGIARAADDVSLQTAPPVVVKTLPEAGKDQIDASLAAIEVTFSKKMRDGSWSWSTVSKDSFPEVTGKPHYQLDKRTCVLPVRLKPGTTYAIWVNSEKFGNFKDANGQPALPYLLVFKTRS